MFPKKRSGKSFLRSSFLRLVGFVLISCPVAASWGHFAEKLSAKKLSTGEVAKGPCQEKRPLRLVHEGQWIGRAICYGPYRVGQHPGGPGPSKQQLRQDLRILAKHWSLLRTYGSTEFVDEMLEVIREEKLSLHVMLGAWIEPEMEPIDGVKQLSESARQANVLQIEKLVELANKYEKIVVAIIVGNETQVEWSTHKVAASRLIEYLRKVRSQTRVPVTTADDFLFWTQKSSRPLAEEVDFIMTHIHPVWHGQEAESALAFVREKYELVTKVNPASLVVIGETGWATQKKATGSEAESVRGKMGEEEQQLACQQIVDWSRERA